MLTKNSQRFKNITTQIITNESNKTLSASRNMQKSVSFPKSVKFEFRISNYKLKTES